MLLALKVKCVISEALVSPNEIAKIMTQASHDPRVRQVMTPETRHWLRERATESVFTL